MKLLKSILIIIFISGYDSIAVSSEWIGEGSVTKIYPYSSRNKIYVEHTALGNGQTGCTLNDFSVIDKATNNMAADLLSVLLSAYTTDNQNVNILVSGCDNSNRPIIVGVLAK